MSSEPVATQDLADGRTDDEGGGIAAMIPNRRMAEPAEVAALMVWLASDESSYISGTEQVIDAGLTAQRRRRDGRDTRHVTLLTQRVDSR